MVRVPPAPVTIIRALSTAGSASRHVRAKLPLCCPFLFVFSQLSVDDMMAKCMSDSELNQTRASLLALKAYAAVFGLPLATYEAGPSIMVRGEVLDVYGRGRMVEAGGLWGSQPPSCCHMHLN